VSAAHALNFMNRLVDWRKLGKRAPHKEAGYVIEEYANAVARSKGAATQYASGGCRPDFRFPTTATYEAKGSSYAAHGLVDSASQAEALAGHISGKALVLAKADQFTHPHLYDAYYPPLNFGVAKPLAAKEEVDEIVKARAAYHAEKAREGIARLRSLRS